MLVVHLRVTVLRNTHLSSRQASYKTLCVFVTSIIHDCLLWPEGLESEFGFATLLCARIEIDTAVCGFRDSPVVEV